MREGWVETTLGNVLTRRSDRLGKGPEPRILTVTEGAGLVDQLAHWGRRVATEDVSAYKVVDPGDVVYNVYLLWNGAIGQNLFRERGVTSPVYEVFTPKAGVESRYLGLLLRSPVLLSAFDSISIGSIQRRRRAPWQDFERISILLPPLAEQRRMVDLIGALDDVAGALADDINAAQETRGFLLEALLARLPEATALKPMGSVGVFLRGRRFTKSDYVDEGLGCIHYGQIHTHLGSVTTHPLTFVPEEMRGRLRLASPGDVVVAATSEDVEGLGKATAWLGKDDVAVHDDCYIFRHSLDPRFATHLFASKGFQRQKVQFASGTKVTRISGANLGRIEVPVPDLADQTVIGQTMSDLDATLDSLTLERSRLRSLRSHALAVLLSGEHEIPKSYDELMEVAS